MTPEKKKHARRSPEQLIADLLARIEDVKHRAERKSLKSSESGAAAVKALRAIDQGLNAADDDSSQALRHVLADARRPLALYLEAQGLKLEKPRLPRGPRPANVA